MDIAFHVLLRKLTLTEKMSNLLIKLITQYIFNSTFLAITFLWNRITLVGILLSSNCHENAITFRGTKHVSSMIGILLLLLSRTIATTKFFSNIITYSQSNMKLLVKLKQLCINLSTCMLHLFLLQLFYFLTTLNLIILTFVLLLHV